MKSLMAAGILPKLVVFLAIFTFSTVDATVPVVNGKPPDNQTVAGKDNHTEQMSHLHFFLHETVAGKDNHTAVAFTNQTLATWIKLGPLYIMDDPLTETIDPKSKVIGRAQGIYALASLNDQLGHFMTFNFVFLEGQYNGSTLSIIGRNKLKSAVDIEMPVVGGTGLFRFARGYVLVKTQFADPTKDKATFEYNVFVYHK